MRRAIHWLPLVLVASLGCGGTNSDSGPVGTELGEHVIGEPLQFANLTIFPVASKKPATDDRFITLDEGLKAGTVEIREQGSDAATPAANNAPRQQTLNRQAPNPPGNAANEPRPQQPAPQPRAQGQPSNQPPAREAVQAPSPGGAGQQGAAQSQRQEQAEVGQQAAQPSRGGGASVNELLVINTSGKPLYLMPGEVIIGGQQDRTIGEETVIASTGQPVPLKVFCVEHGRWQQREVAHNVGYLATLQANESQPLSRQELEKLAEDANSGKFVKSAGQVNKDIRLAVQGEMSQPKVWEQVAALNAKNGAKNDSGAFTENYGGKDIATKLDPYLEALQKKVSDQTNVVGVIVAVDGKVQSVDIFESTPLFQKLWPKLLKSYALDAVASGEAAEAKECTVADACDFLKEVTEAKVEKTDGNASVAITRRENSRVASFSAAPQPSVPIDRGGGADKPVHVSGFAK